MQFGILSLTGFAILYLTPVISAYAVASPVTQSSVPDDKFLQPLEEAFAVVESIPDDVLDAGDEATGKWVKEHYRSKGDESGLGKRWPDLVEIAQCVYELVTNIPAAKLLKIKRIVERLGGWEAAAKKLLEARRNPKNIVGLVQELVDLILGISDIKKECWDDFQ